MTDVRWVCVTAVLAAPLAAHADPAPPALASSPFVSLDRQSGESLAGIEAIYAKATTSSDTILHFELHGQYVDPETHVGGYLDLPMNISGSENFSASLDGMQLGAIYVAPVAPTAAVILHGGLVLPTAGKDDTLDNTLIAVVTRPRDAVTAIPGVTLRLGASPMVRSGDVFARADVDLDVNLSNSAGNTADPLLTVGGGIGAFVGQFAFTAELGLTHAFSNAEIKILQNPTTVGASARYAAGPVHPYVAVTVPLDSDSRSLYDYAVTLGAVFVQP